MIRRHGARGLALSLALGVSACGNDRYVIGRFRDASCDAQKGALFCSGFERPDLSDWSGRVVKGKGSVEQEEGRVRTGRGALHASSSGAESVGVVAAEFPPVTSGTVSLRAYLYVPAGTPTQTMNVLFLGDYPSPDPFEGVDVNLENDAPSVYVPGSAPDRTTSTTVFIPRDRWFCLQLDVAVGAAGAVTVRVDGATALSVAPQSTLSAAGVHLLRAGVDWSSLQQAPFDVYMDDLVLSTAPVACDGA